MLVPSIRLPLRMATMPDRSGLKSHDWRTRVALGLIVMAAPTSCSNDDCSRILRHVSRASYCGVWSGGGKEGGIGVLWDANRHFVACPTQTDSSTESGDSGAHDDDFHDFGYLHTAVAVL